MSIYRVVFDVSPKARYAQSKYKNIRYVVLDVYADNDVEAAKIAKQTWREDVEQSKYLKYSVVRQII